MSALPRPFGDDPYDGLNNHLIYHLDGQNDGLGDVSGDSGHQLDPGSRPGGDGHRLVTVLLTMAVPTTADPEDATALAPEAAAATALHVVHAVGVEGHLRAPGATVVPPRPLDP